MTLTVTAPPSVFFCPTRNDWGSRAGARTVVAAVQSSNTKGAVSVLNPSTCNGAKKPEAHGTEETGIDRPAASSYNPAKGLPISSALAQPKWIAAERNHRPLSTEQQNSRVGGTDLLGSSCRMAAPISGAPTLDPLSTSSGVDSDTLALRLLQGERPAAMGTAGDMWEASRNKRHSKRKPLLGSNMQRAGRGDSAVTRHGEDSAAMPCRCNSGLDVDSLSPRTARTARQLRPAEITAAQRLPLQPHSRACRTSSSGTGFFQ